MAARTGARQSFGVPTDDFVALFVGKLEPKKRPLDVIRAMGQLGDATTLLLVGSGPLEKQCRQEAARLNVTLVETLDVDPSDPETRVGENYIELLFVESLDQEVTLKRVELDRFIYIEPNGGNRGFRDPGESVIRVDQSEWKIVAPF